MAGAAVQAPSVHNTQPWWFGHGEHEISVHADNERQLRVADPQGREMMISCGAALFNVRVALRKLGFVPKVRVLPDPDLPNLVARVSWGDRMPPVEYEKRLFAEIPRRRTHRGAFDPAPLPAVLLADLSEEAAREKAMLSLLGEAEDQQRAAGHRSRRRGRRLRPAAQQRAGQGGSPVGAGSQQPPAGRRASHRLPGAARAHRAEFPQPATSPTATDGDSRNVRRSL